MRRGLAAGVAAALVWGGGCWTVGPDYRPPAEEAPDGWLDADPEVYAGPPEARLANWWSALDDPLLGELIASAFAHNPDLAVAYERVREARAGRSQVASARFPTLDGTGAYSRARSGSNSFPALPEASTFDRWTLGLETGWELDLWGRVRRSVEAADAEAQAALELARDVRVLLAGEVARQLIEARTFQERLRVARENIAIQERSLGIARTRFDAGLSPALDVAQAETNLAATEAEVPALASGLRATTLRLGTLVGELPGPMVERLAQEGTIPLPPERLGLVLPAEVLRQRPDVRAAERSLAAEVARIGVAQAEYLPLFSLGGSVGYEATETSDLFDRDSGFLGLGPSFRWNLFSAGRVRAGVEAQRARAEASRLTYRGTVLAALEEVEGLAFAHAQERLRQAALERAVTAARRTVELARELYTAGQSDFQNVLDAERSLFQAEDRLLASRGQVALTFVSLHQALGGGWQGETP